MKKAFLGYQLYSAREECARDLAGTVRQISDMGYDGVELAGFYGNTAQQFREELDKAGLVAISSHVAYDAMKKDVFRVISDHLTLGCRFVAIPALGGDERVGMVGFGGTLRNLYKFGELFKKAGLQLLYHNHDFEFLDVMGQPGLDFMYDATPAGILETELDTCWIRHAGYDPLEYLRKYAGRERVVHLKDFVGNRKCPEEKGEFQFRPVGYGCQDVRGIVDAALDGGCEWFIVEQDASVGRPPLDAARMSAEFVRPLLG